MSDKDSVAPERIRVIVRRGKDDWIGIAYSANAPNSDKIHEYIRDNGDLVSRSAVVERLRELAGSGGTQPWWKAKVNALADEFEAADKDEELK